MDPQLLTYYEAIERTSAAMLAAARAGHWDDVVKLEGECVLLISQLKQAAQGDAQPALGDAQPAAAASPLPDLPGEARVDAQADPMEASKLKSRIMQRILVNDAEIRQLAEPWLTTLDDVLEGRQRTLH